MSNIQNMSHTQENARGELQRVVVQFQNEQIVNQKKLQEAQSEIHNQKHQLSYEQSRNQELENILN